MAESGLLHDDLVALGRAVSNSGVSQYPPDMLSFQSGFMPPDPFAGVYNDAYSRRYAAQIQANSIRNAGAFARRAREEADRRLAGDLITDVAGGLGFVAGMPAGGTIGGMAGALGMGLVTEQILQATGFFDFDPLVSLNEQAQAMVDSSIHQFAFSIGGLGLDRGISMDAARDIGSQLFDQARGAGLHGVEVSRMMNAMEPYAAQLHLSKDPRELGDQLEKYLDGLIEVVQRTNTSIERASQMLAQGTMMGISPENAGSTFATIAGYAGVADISPSQMMQIGMQAAAPFSGTGFGYGDVLASTASTMAGASLASMNSRNATLWAAIGGPQQFGIHQANLASSFAANPEMVGRLMGSGSFDYANWNNMMSGSALSDGYGDAYSELNTNDKLLAQYNGMQEMLARPGQWERAALGSVLGQMIEDDITNPNAQAMALWRSGYAPNLATGRQMVSSFQAQQSNDYGASLVFAARENALANQVTEGVSNASFALSAAAVMSAMGNNGSYNFANSMMDWFGTESSRNLMATDRQVLGMVVGDINDRVNMATAIERYGTGTRNIRDIAGQSLEGTPESIIAMSEALANGESGMQINIEQWNRYINTLSPEIRYALEPTTSYINDRSNQYYNVNNGGDLRVDQPAFSRSGDYRYGHGAWEIFHGENVGIAAGRDIRAVESFGQDVSGLVAREVNRYSTGENILDLVIPGLGTIANMVGGGQRNAPIEAHGVTMDPEEAERRMAEYLNMHDPTQYLTMTYQQPLIDYAMQSGWSQRNISPGDRKFASLYNSSLEELAMRSSMLDSDQLNARLNQLQDPSGFNSGWVDFLRQVETSGAIFNSSGDMTETMDSFANQVYNRSFSALDQSQQDYIRTYAGVSNVDYADSSSILNSMFEMSGRRYDDAQYRAAMRYAEERTGLTSENISKIAMYGMYRSRLSSDSLSASERSDIQSAMNAMILEDPNLMQNYNTYYGSITANAGSQDMIMQFAMGGSLDEQIARQEDIWSRVASSSSGPINELGSLSDLRNLSARDAYVMFKGKDLSQYSPELQSIIETLQSEGGSAVSSADILALQDLEFINSDAPGPSESGDGVGSGSANGSSEHPFYVKISGIELDSEQARGLFGFTIPQMNAPSAESPEGDE